MTVQVWGEFDNKRRAFACGPRHRHSISVALSMRENNLFH